MVDFRKLKTVPSTLTVNNSEVEIVDSFEFLGIHITSNLSWSVHARYMCKKDQQRLYFPRCLKKLHIKPEILANCYRSIIRIDICMVHRCQHGLRKMRESARNDISRTRANFARADKCEQNTTYAYTPSHFIKCRHIIANNTFNC